jgi:hypothetical protein
MRVVAASLYIRKNRDKVTAGIIALIFGVALIAIGIYNFVRILQLKKSGLRADAVVFDIKKSTSYRTVVAYFPIVRFVTEKGEWITIQTTIGVFPGTYKKGTQVVVTYNPLKPTECYILSTSTNVIPLLLLIAGIALSIFALINLLDIQQGFSQIPITFYTGLDFTQY